MNEVGSNVIGISWNPKALKNGDVYIVLMEAKPLNNSLPLARTKTYASEGKISLTNNIRPSSVYQIRVSDTHGRGFVYLLGEITTLPPGELFQEHSSQSYLMLRCQRFISINLIIICNRNEAEN